MDLASRNWRVGAGSGPTARHAKWSLLIQQSPRNPTAQAAEAMERVG